MVVLSCRGAARGVEAGGYWSQQSRAAPPGGSFLWHVDAGFCLRFQVVRAVLGLAGRPSSCSQPADQTRSAGPAPREEEARWTPVQGRLGPLRPFLRGGRPAWRAGGRAFPLRVCVTAFLRTTSSMGSVLGSPESRSPLRRKERSLGGAEQGWRRPGGPCAGAEWSLSVWHLLEADGECTYH